MGLFCADDRSGGELLVFQYLKYVSCIGFLSILIAGVNSPVIACSLTGLQHKVKFHTDEYSLGIREAVTLARWFIQQRDARPHDEVDIVSMYPAGNERLAEISKVRTHNISRIIDAMNADRIPVVISSGEGQQPVLGPVGYVYNEVLVVMAPSCTRTGNCCGISVR